MSFLGREGDNGIHCYFKQGSDGSLRARFGQVELSSGFPRAQTVGTQVKMAEQCSSMA